MEDIKLENELRTFKPLQVIHYKDHIYQYIQIQV